ncbi:OsmC family protein [Coprothermobacteraceae bacterium]|nr:OsmC family protein [Coprothermobacteraceae bacterium]
MPMVSFSVKTEWKGGLLVEAKAGQHTIVIDEPSNLGGTDKGPNPVEYILAAWGGCLTIVGVVVAKEKNIPIKSIRVELEGELDPSVFMGKNKEGRAGYHKIIAKLHVDADATTDVLEEWLHEIERRCPVADNLANPTPIEVKLA